MNDKGQAQGGVFGIQSRVAAGGAGERAMCILARPLRATKVDEQSMHSISGGSGVRAGSCGPMQGQRRVTTRG